MKFYISISGKDSFKVYKCFKHKVNGTKTKISEFILSNGSIDFNLECENFDNFELFAFRIISIMNLCEKDWSFKYLIFEPINDSKRIVCFN